MKGESEVKSCHYGTASPDVVPLPVGTIWVEPSRKVEKWILPDGREAAPKHRCWVTTRRKPFFLQVQHPVSTNKDNVCFFCLIRVCYSVKSHKQRLSLYLYTHKQEQNWLSWQCFLHKIEEFKFSGLLLLLFFRVWTLCLEFGSDNRVHFGSSHPEKCIKHSGLLICATLFSPAEMINVWFKMYLGYTA